MTKFFGFVLTLMVLSSCSNGQNNSVNKEDLLAHDVELYKNTPAWKLAKAVKNQDTSLIKKICRKDSSLINFQEKKFGQTLLEWTVYTNRFKAAKALAEMGADPNIQSYNGTSAFIHAADKLNTSKYLRLLLKYGGNVNAVADTSKKQPERTPLIAASKSRLESVKLLVEAGANVNYKYNGISALRVAAVQDKIKIVKYLIKHGAEFKKPLLTTLDGEKRYLHHLLRSMVFEIGSEKYKTKMWVVDTLQDHGMNYWETEVPEHLKENYNKEYLKKY